MPFVLDWKGGEVEDKMKAAVAVGIDADMALAVRLSKENHPSYPPPSAPGERYANRTGHLTGSISIKASAAPVGPIIAGEWGADANYALYVEIGTSRKESGMPRAQVRELQGMGNMWDIPGPSVPPLMAARYTLRPAATDAYPYLAAFIGAAFRGEEA